MQPTVKNTLIQAMHSEHIVISTHKLKYKREAFFFLFCEFTFNTFHSFNTFTLRMLHFWAPPQIKQKGQTNQTSLSGEDTPSLILTRRGAIQREQEQPAHLLTHWILFSGFNLHFLFTSQSYAH